MRKYPYHLITSTGLGFSYSSLTQIGDVLPPDSGLGQANIGLYFNVKTLNVYVEDQMADFVEAGLKLPTGFIYNSANNTWQFYLRRFSQLPASTNDTATLIEADGHETTYFYDSVNAFFIPPRTGQGFPILQFDENNKSWVLYHSELRVIEIYDQQGLLRERRNHVGQKISFEYDGENNLNKINGYSGNVYLLNRQIESTTAYSIDLILQKADGSQQKIQHYEFANNLLQTSTRYDFLNNKLTGYITTYRYATDNSILLSILQDDGTQLDTKIIAGNQRSVTLGNRSGTNSDGLSFMISTQENNSVRVTAGNPGFQLDFILDANGQLQSLKRYNGSGTYDENQTEISQYVYNDKNELTQIKHPNNTQETRNFDSIFGFLIEHTHIQNQLLLSKIQFNYEINTKRPQLVSKVTTLSSSPSTVVTRNVYEHKNLNDISSESTFLRYIISPEGRVTANHYADDGYVHEKRAYTGAFYPVDTLKPESVPALTDMEQWEQLQISQMPKAVKIKQYEHDPHGLVRSLKMFADIDAQGNGIENASSSCELLVRDDFGQQTQSQIKIDVKSETDFTPVFTAKNQVYDFMQRLVQVTDELNQQTTHEYIISANVQTIKTTFANKRQETTLLSSLKIPSNIAASAFDASGSTLQHRNTQSTFDPKGRIYQTQLPGGLIQYTCFDAQDRVNATINQAGQYNENNYSNIPNGRYAIETEYANLISVDHLNQMATQYFAADVIKNIFFKDLTDSEHDRVSYQFFDGLDHLRYEIDAENFFIEYRYDEADRKTDEIHYFDPITQDELTTLFQGKGLIRVINITRDRWTSFYYGCENLMGMVDPDGWVTEKCYNSGNDIIEKIAYATPQRSINRSQQFSDMRPPLDKENDAHHYYFYDGRGQVILSVDPEGYITQSQYSSDGLVQQRYYFYNKVDASWYQDTSKLPNLPPVHTEDRTEIFKYDNKRRLTRHYFQNGSGKWFEYDVVDNTIKKKIYDTRFVTENPSPYDYNGDTCRITEAQYDGWGQLERVANPFIAAKMAQFPSSRSDCWYTQSLRKTIDDSGLILSSTNSIYETTLFYSDVSHRLLLSIDAEGAIIENTYNNFNEIILVHHYINKIPANSLIYLGGGFISDSIRKFLIPTPDDLIESKCYDRRGLLIEAVDGEGYSTQNYYNAFQEMQEMHLPVDQDKKQVIKFTYDPRGNLTQTDKFPLSDSQLNPITIRYKHENIYSHPTHAFDENNNQTQFNYDRVGNNIEILDPESGKIHRSYDAYNRKINETNELNCLSTWVYSQQDQSTVRTTPNGSKIITTQNIFNEEVKNLNSINCVTVTTHNVNAQIISISVTIEGKVKIITKEYDTEGKITFETDPLNKKTGYDYNKTGALTRTILDAGNYPTNLNIKTLIEPDALGRPIAITNPGGVVTTQKFNKNNLIIYSIKDPGTAVKPGIGFTETQTYNARGDRTFLMQGDIVDPNQYAIQFLFDDFVRPVGKIIDPIMPGIEKPLNSTEINVLDAKGHVVAHKDPKGNITRYFYDANDNQRFKINGCGGIEAWEFDPHHRKVSYHQYSKIIDIKLLTDQTSLEDLQRIISNQSLKTPADALIYYRYDDNDNERFVLQLLYDNKNQKYQALILEKRYDSADRHIMEIGYYNTIPFDDINNFTYQKLVALMPSYADQRDRKTYYILDEVGQKRFIIDPERLIIENIYDLKGRILIETKYSTPCADPDLLVGQLSSQIVVPKNIAADRTTYTAFNIFDLATYVVGAEGEVRWHEYDANKNLTELRVGGPLKILASDNYDSVMAKTSYYVSGPASLRTTQYIFNNLDQQTFIIDACRNKDEFVRNALGQIKEHIDRAKVVHKFNYDRAQREVLSTICSAEIMKMTADETLHLNGVNEVRDIQKYTEYDACNNVTRVIKDYQYDERETHFGYTLINILQSATTKNVVVNDINQKASLTHLPVQILDAQIQKIYDGKGQVVAEQKENTAWNFYVNDNLGRTLYILHQEEDGLSIIGFERNTFGEIVKKTRYANKIQVNIEEYLKSGIPIGVIENNIKIDSANDRSTQFKRDHRGSILEVRKDKALFYQPDLKQMDYAESISTYVNSIFGERQFIRRNRFPNLPQLDIQIFKWNNRVGKLVAHAEAIQDFMTGNTLDSAAVQFRVNRWQYNPYNEISLFREYATPLTTLTLSMTVDELDKSCQLSTFDRVLTNYYDNLGNISIEQDDTANINTTKYFTYTPVEKIYSIRRTPNEGGLSVSLDEYCYYNAQNKEIARVGTEEGVHQSPGNISTIARTLTLYAYNSHGERVQTQRFAEGTASSADDRSKIPPPLKPDPACDEIEKILYDIRGLPKIKQDAENNITVSLFNLSKKISRQFWQLTNMGVGVTPSVDHLDEKSWVWDQRNKLLFASYLRDGIQTQATQYQYNNFGECTGEGAGDNQFPLFRYYDSIGQIWKENSEKGITTINLFDLQGIPTGLWRSAKLDLSLNDYANLPSLIVQSSDLEITHFFTDMSKRLLCKMESSISQEDPAVPRSVPLTIEVNAPHAVRAFGQHSITWAKIPNTTLKMYLKLEQIDGYKTYPEIEVETYNGITGINADDKRLNLPSDIYRYTVTYVRELLSTPQRRYQYQPQLNGSFNLEDVNQLLAVTAKMNSHVEILPVISLFNDRFFILTENMIALERKRRIAFSRKNFKVQDILFLPIQIKPKHWSLLILEYQNNSMELKRVQYIDPVGDLLLPKILTALQDDTLHPKLNAIETLPLGGNLLEEQKDTCAWMIIIANQLANNNLTAFYEFNIDSTNAFQQCEEYLIEQSEVHPSQLKSGPVPQMKKVYQSTGILHIDTDRLRESQRVIPIVESDHHVWLSGRIDGITAIEIWHEEEYLNHFEVTWDEKRNKPYVNLDSAKDIAGNLLPSDIYTIKAVRGEEVDLQGSLPVRLFSYRPKYQSNPIARHLDFRAQFHFLGKKGELGLWDLPLDFAAAQIKIICEYIDQNNLENIYADVRPNFQISSHLNKENNQPIIYTEILFAQSVKAIRNLTLSLLLPQTNRENIEILLYKEEKPLPGIDGAHVTFTHEERVHAMRLESASPCSASLKEKIKNSSSLSSSDSEWVVIDELNDEATHSNESLQTIHFTPRSILYIAPINLFLKNTKTLLYSHFSYLDSSSGFMAEWKQLPISSFNKSAIIVDITLLLPGIYNYKLVGPEVADHIESETHQFIRSSQGLLFLSEENIEKNNLQISPTWKYGYDVWDNKTKEQDPYTRITLYEFNRYNKKTKTTFPSINVTDEQGNIESKITSVVNAYNVWGNKIHRTDENGCSEYFWLVNRREVIHISGDGNHERTNGYNALGLNITYNDSCGSLFSQDFDRLRNIIRTARSSHPAPVAVNPLNSLGWFKTFAYDQRSQRVLIRDEENNTLIYQHDERGNIITIIDGFNLILQTTTYHRSNQPQLINYPYNPFTPDGLTADRTVVMNYDYFGNLQDKILMNGTKITYHLDFKKQVVGLTSSGEVARFRTSMATYLKENSTLKNTFLSENIWHLSVSSESMLLPQNIIYEYENGLLRNIYDVSQNQHTEYYYDLLKRRNHSIVKFNDSSIRNMTCSFNARGWQDTTSDSNASVQTGYDAVGNVRYQAYQFRSGSDVCSGIFYSKFDTVNRVLCDQGVLQKGKITIIPDQGTEFGYFQGRGTSNFRSLEKKMTFSMTINTRLEYFDDGCIHSTDSYDTNNNVFMTSREYYSNDLLYLYTEDNKTAPFKETYKYDANLQLMWMNRANDSLFLQKTEYSNRDRFGQYNRRFVYLADDSRTTFENDNYFFEIPQIWQVRATTHLPDGTEKQLQPAQFFYDANRHPCGKISNNLADELEKVSMNVLTDSGAIVRKQHITTSTDHPAYGQVTELAFMDPNENYFASYTLCDDPRDRVYNDLRHKYPDKLKGGGTAAISAKGANEWFGSGRAGQAMKFQILSPVENIIDYPTPASFDEYKSFFGGDNPAQGFKNYIPSPMSTFPSSSPQFYVVPSHLNSGQTDMSLAEISQYCFGSPRYAAQIAAANGLPITARCKPGEHLSIPPQSK